MTELDFCAHWCGALSPAQELAILHYIEIGAFRGVGRGVGDMNFSPLVVTDDYRDIHYVIIASGEYTLAAKEGQMHYNKATS